MTNQTNPDQNAVLNEMAIEEIEQTIAPGILLTE